MTISGAFRARDPQAAAHSARLILLVCAGAVAVLTSIGQNGSTTLALTASWLGTVVLLGLASLCSARPAVRLDRYGFSLGIALFGVVLAVALNVATTDTSAAGQAFYAFPVFWAASHLRPGGVAVVTAAAVAGDLAGLLLLVAVDDALTDGLVFGSVIVVMAVMLTRANVRQERLVAALGEQARVDALTGLVNRRAFDDALGSTLDRPHEAGTALVLIDVDAFKTVNDEHGHPVGDALLMHLAGLLRAQIRAEDAVLSRLGGDELAVLMPDCPRHVAERRANELLDRVHTSPLPLADGGLLPFTISVGVAHLPASSTAVDGDLEPLYHAADAALYDAKRAGRARVSTALA